MLLGMGITTENVVAIRGVEIDFYVKLVGIESLSLRVAQIVLKTTAGWGGVQRGAKQRLGHWINWLRNHVIRKRQPGLRIIELVGLVNYIVYRDRVVTDTGREGTIANIPKIALPLLCSEDVEELRGRGVVESLALIVKEEEQLVLDNRTADRATEHIPAQLVCRRRIESIFPGIRVQLVIAKILP